MSVLEATIGWLAPANCISCGTEGSALCDVCSTSGIVPHGERCGYCGRLSPNGLTCPACRHFGGPRSVWISSNHEGLTQQLVQVYKFGHLRAAVGPITVVMLRTLLRFNSAAQLKAANYLVIPLPTATSRARRRGFDHAALLAKAISRQTGLEYGQALGRLGQARQVGASRSSRLTQSSDDYFVRHPHRVHGRNILLVDDVITTGGSLAAAAKSLSLSGASRVDALVFAKRL